MNILISEYNNDKFYSINQIIRKHFPDVTIKRRKTVIDTFKMIDNTDLDLIIQDMQMPIRSGEDIVSNAGLQCAKSIRLRSTVPIAICSSDSSVGIDVAPDFDFIHYNVLLLELFEKDLLEYLDDV